MGVDFIRERARGFVRSWDSARVELATRTLFTSDPSCRPRAAIASCSASRPVLPGTVWVVRCENGGLVAYEELTQVARFVDPPPELVAAVGGCGGCATGEVIEVYSPSLLEIAIC